MKTFKEFLTEEKLDEGIIDKAVKWLVKNTESWEYVDYKDIVTKTSKGRLDTVISMKVLEEKKYLTYFSFKNKKGTERMAIWDEKRLGSIDKLVKAVEDGKEVILDVFDFDKLENNGIIPLAVKSGRIK